MKKISDSKQRKIGAVLSYLSIIVNTLVQLLYIPFLIRNLGQSEYGLYSLTASIIGYLTLFDLGFGNAIVVYTSKYLATNQEEKAKKLHGMFKVVFYILGAFVALGGMILYFNVENIFSNTMNPTEIYEAKIMMLILTLNLVVTFSFNIYSSIINAYEKFIFQKIMAIISTLLKPALMIPLLFLGYKSIEMCLVITFVNILVVLSNYLFCKKRLNVTVKYKGFDKIILKEIFKYSIFIFINIIVDKVNWSLDQFILGSVCGTIAVSIYSISTNISTLFISLSTAISNVLLPKVSKMIAKNASPKELTNEMIKVGRIQWLIILLMTTGLILVGREFFINWAGAEYEQSYYVALVLVIPVCFPLIQNLGISICQAKNKHRFRAYATLIMAIINGIISYFLAKTYGPIGAAAGTAISLIVCNIIIMNIYYQKILKLNMMKFWKEIIAMSVPFFIPLILIIVFINLIKINGFLSILVYGGIYTVLYCITAYFISMNEYERNIVDKVLIKFHLKKVKYARNN